MPTSCQALSTRAKNGDVIIDMRSRPLWGQISNHYCFWNNSWLDWDKLTSVWTGVCFSQLSAVNLRFTDGAIVTETCAWLLTLILKRGTKWGCGKIHLDNCIIFIVFSFRLCTITTCFAKSTVFNPFVSKMVAIKCQELLSVVNGFSD